MRKKRVLLLSEGFGAGHTQAAYALSSSLRKLSPHIQTRVLELGNFLNPKMAPLIVSAYRKTVTSQPRLMGYVYRHQKSFNRLTTLALHRLFYTHTQNIVRQLKPDIIVCTHFIPSAVVSRLKRLDPGFKAPLVTVITDYDAHASWISPEVDRYLVSTPEVKAKLHRRSVPSAKIQVTGMPVHPSFWEHPGRQEILEQFSLQDLPTVLVMGGGWGMMNDNVVNEGLAGWREKVQIVFCLGRNEKLLDEMKADPAYRHPNISLIGFTRDIDKLMEVSDLLVTKPGGMTCSEGLAKGIPMLFHNPLPGQEEENVRYFTSAGLGEAISSLEVVDKWMERLLYHYDDVQAKRKSHLEAIAKFHPLQSAQSIIDMLD
ncbi:MULTISPECIES: glycosyltransferase [unclassified Paenibacillus]|uniref:MGDG synthase family glycosyltransferase n=1 Tax=unclassified Paenibacillus TaxID=185978 RepID=UPI002405043B|nr:MULTISPECIES: glycosyltransferase [unclassified Paenibacillus]MDF9850155.1 processive 1,2-diacylglycerol beta-glucosyltransferase [Paenibacillus sp. PastM-2]MDH6482374.1 processive 1,2-diacylglycerol beta-glucosyltransferase [Paenibacillus sp. PastH-2]MDH6509288.1 processive 1,2-diacylglycerol beta-glucosyltransferase [Paenibacillus sp. PastM-3]